MTKRPPQTLGDAIQGQRAEPALPVAAEAELKVTVSPLEFWEYEGTQAQLQAEGGIPTQVEWPNGAAIYRWQSERFVYWLRRNRPVGLKGPMKLWTSGDCWIMRCNYKHRLDHGSRAILRKRFELEREIYRQSAAGQREWEAHWDRFRRALRDDAFQAFKSTLIPELNKGGRKPKGKGSATSA